MGLKSYTEEKLNAWNEAEVKIAVTGQSGTGKSSLINRLRGLTPEDRKKPYYAKTGAGKETTSERREYEFPSSPLIKIYDLPGCGTPAFPRNSYADEMEFDIYDAFVILTKDRFLEEDKAVATMIHTLAKPKPFFFCRSNMDETMKNAAKDELEDFDHEKLEKNIRDDCLENLEDRAEYAHAKHIYLLARDDPLVVKAGEREDTVKFPDNMKLKEDLIGSLNDLQRSAIRKLDFSIS